MIPKSRPAVQTGDWRRSAARAVTDPAELLALLHLPRDLLPAARAAAAGFPLRVPREFVARMKPGNPRDPLLRQVLPLGEELTPAPGFGTDPLGEADAHAAPGLLHKYPGRALLITTPACAVHCRYCFRRHFPYEESRGELGQWEEALAHLRADEGIREIILSGGDPLSLSDERLERLLGALADIPHLQRLRLHSRLPGLIPSRVTPRLTAMLGNPRFLTSLVLHVNHPQELNGELDGELAEALAPLRAAGVTLLNQSVLLAGINDDADTLTALSEGLFRAGVLPYYLHLLDPVQGSAHFDCAQERALALIRELRRRLPGYLVPRLVREEAGKMHKSAIC